MQELKFTCPCCGYQTLDEEPPGTFDICHVCFWEDDSVQFDDPDYRGGANTLSLRQCQQNFMAFGACDERCRSFVKPPSSEEVKDPNWEPLNGQGGQPQTPRPRLIKQAFHLPGPLDNGQQEGQQ